MIEIIRGNVSSLKPSHVILDVGGIGYFINISLHTFYAIEKTGRPIATIFTRFIVKEDSQKLYGFDDEEERDLFDKLTSVSGIGPNTALVVLSHMTVSEVKVAIGSGNADAIKKVKGIGGKTADRLILELKSKFEAEVKDVVAVEVTGPIKNVQVISDAIAALVVLGIDKKKATEAIKYHLGPTVQDYVKQVLAKM